MTTIKNFFFYVVDRPDDPFLGLKHLLSQDRQAHHILREVRLAPENLKVVKEVEYSMRRYFRFLFYKTVFQQLENSLREALRECDPDDRCVIYFSDEGVWAEFLRVFRRRHYGRRFLAVNVQHGFERRIRITHRNLRRVANWLSITSLGFPVFGMGCFGGVGGGVFEVYLTYDEGASDFVKENTGDLAYECPFLIKHALVERFKMARQSLIDGCRDGQDVMFALQPAIDNIKGNTLSIFEELTPVAKLLVERYGRRIVLRAHPGTDHDRVMRDYRQSCIDCFADMDGRSDLGHQLARCSVVMSYDSTVLWEAYILGLVPVSVQGGSYNGELSFPHEVLYLSSNLEAQLENVLRPETAQKYRCQMAERNLDWEEKILGLIRGKSEASVS